MRPLLATLCVIAVAAAATVLTAARAAPLVTADAEPAMPETALMPRVHDVAPTDVPVVSRFIVPIAGTSIPAAPELLPGSAREYRRGVHEGIDLPAKTGTLVLAAAAGEIVRMDTDFGDWDATERDRALAEARALGHTPERTLDLIRGRQVWIDHGHGIVTRYAHLAAVSPYLAVGYLVAPGTSLGLVGNSGYPEGGPHLHFEIRVGDDFFGDGLSPADLSRAIMRAFE